MIKDLFFKSWNLINSGSLEVEVAQEKNIANVNLDKDTVIVDVKDARYPLISALKNINYGIEIESREDKKVKKSSISDKKDKIKNLLNRVGDIASLLAENNKTFVLKHKGKELVKIGEDTKSLIPSLKKRHIQIPNKIRLILFLKEISISSR